MIPTLVLSVGGSLVAPASGIDVDFLGALKKVLLKHTKKQWRFVIVVGGGSTARQYQQAARAIGKLASDDLDWLGIHATRLNGHLLRTVFRDVAHPVMIKDPSKPIGKWKGSVLIAAGWKPGWSTDYVATKLAKQLKSSLLVNLSNIDFVYDKDPNQHKDAVPLHELTWGDFRHMVGNTWDPGMNAPFDPVASRLAQQAGMSVAIVNGKNIENLDRLLSGKSFKGTVIG